MPLSSYNVRIACVFSGFLLCFGLLGGWLYQLQIRRHPEFYAQARRIYAERIERRGSRGPICDADGNLLAGTAFCKDVLAEPRRMPPSRRELIIWRLSRFLRVAPELLRRRFDSARVEIVVKRKVDFRRARALANQRIPGLRFIDSQFRYYPKGTLAASLIGFTNEKNEGVYGLERLCEQYVKPQIGSFVYEHDRLGRGLHHKKPTEPTALDGKAVYLTLREPLQHIVEEELARLVREYRPKYAYAVMANPKTGAVLALAQLPSFDPNDRRRMDPETWRSHLISDVYDPGSIMKGIAICGALEYGVVTLDTKIYCENGRWTYAGKVLRDSHPYGWLTVREIVQKSSNIGTAKIALLMGEARLYQTLRRFGFGERTGIGLPDESAGIYRPLNRWDKLSITRFPIGQGISVTPLQMVQAYSALANHGRMMQLHLIARVADPGEGEVIFKTEAKLKRTAATRAAARKIVSALKLVTARGGTGRRGRVKGYQTAGKTGTSQKLVNGSYTGHGKYVASFIGFVPADDPAFVLLVVADEPQGNYYGGTVCAPSFSRIAEQALRYLNVPPADVMLTREGRP